MATHQMITRSMTREVLAYPFTLHPNALRKLGMAEPVHVPSRPDWIPSFAPEWDHDDYSPTSPSRTECKYGSREHAQWILHTSK
jgi:hypothetical protein